MKNISRNIFGKNILFLSDNNKIISDLKEVLCLYPEIIGRNKTEIEVLAIGIGHDVSRYYDKAIKITDVNELGDVMISQLSSLFDAKKNFTKH